MLSGIARQLRFPIALLMIRAFLISVALLTAGTCFAQEITPRAYWPAPKGTKLLVFAYGHQAGDVITAASLPIENAKSRSNSVILGFQRTFSLFGRHTNLQFELPLASGSTRANVEGVPARRDVSGTGDIAATLSINLLGAPSLSSEAFQSFRKDPRPILGLGLKIVAPTGQYDDDRLVNIGSNRWSARVRLGYIQPLTDLWVLELSAGTWFFQDNEDFVSGTREQKPVTAFDFSLIRRIRPGFWASLDGTHYIGGRTTVDDTINVDYQRNSRLGFSVAYPFKNRHLWKISFSNDIRTEFGGDYKTVTLSYAYRLR
jgi:hypothetical protein